MHVEFSAVVTNTVSCFQSLISYFMNITKLWASHSHLYDEWTVTEVYAFRDMTQVRTGVWNGSKTQ